MVIGLVKRHSHTGKIKKRVEPITQDQNPIFLLGQEGKTGVLSRCGGQKFNKVLRPCVILEANKANADPRRPNPWKVRPKR